MRIIHLADLHLGKKVFGYNLEEEQRDMLAQVLALVEEKKTHAVLLCGDIYDTAMPPVSAVELLDWFLNELHTRGQSVLMISGNHDSAGRLSFGSQLLEASDLHIASVYDGSVPFVDLEEGEERVRVHMLPFIKPVTIRAVHERECASWDEAMAIAMETVELDLSVSNILMSHQFYMGSETSDSETHSVGTLDQISTSFLEPFDYAALGHLHKPQAVGDERFRYPGSLLKYSASELDWPRAFTVLETQPDHSVKIERIPAVPKRDFVRLQGTFDEIVSREFRQSVNPEDYVYIVLEDEQEVFQAFEKLSSIYERLLKIEYSHLHKGISAQDLQNVQTKMKSFEEIACEFFELQNGIEPSPQQKEALFDAWEAVHETD